MEFILDAFFSDLALSLNFVSLSFTHVDVCSCSSFMSTVAEHSSVWMCLSTMIFFYWWWRVGCFQCFALRNKTTVSILFFVSWYICKKFSLVMYLEIEFLGHRYVHVQLYFSRINELLPTLDDQIAIFYIFWQPLLLSDFSFASLVCGKQHPVVLMCILLNTN